MRLQEDITIHDTLNPKLFDLETKKLLPKVREKIIDIVKVFEEFVEYPMEICDVQLVGSNASFNWHDGSDVDVHIIVNTDDEKVNPELVQELFQVKKSQFNKKYDIKFGVYPVSLYVQDINSGIVSNGIYSVCDDAWVKEPKPITSVKKYDNTELLNKWAKQIDAVLKSKDINAITDTLNRLYLMRHNSIAADGEYGQGNQLFKDIRNMGLTKKLKDAKAEAVSKQLSMESYSKGYVINNLDE